MALVVKVHLYTPSHPVSESPSECLQHVSDDCPCCLAAHQLLSDSFHVPSPPSLPPVWSRLSPQPGPRATIRG